MTPQQNGVVERKNRSQKELARTMLNESNLSKYFCTDAVYTTFYVLNRTLIRPILNKTPYELYKGRKPNISHLRVFGCKCFILNNSKANLILNLMKGYILAMLLMDMLTGCITKDFLLWKNLCM